MANNRMLLVYRPTGDAVFLGKRMMAGWYGVRLDLPARITELFNRAEKAMYEAGTPGDQFVLLRESDPAWRYKSLADESGICKVEFVV